MLRGPQRICVAPNAGCDEIFGRRSRVPSTPACEDVTGKMARDGLKEAEDGNIIGREGPRKDVNVLGRVSLVY